MVKKNKPNDIKISVSNKKKPTKSIQKKVITKDILKPTKSTSKNTTLKVIKQPKLLTEKIPLVKNTKNKTTLSKETRNKKVIKQPTEKNITSNVVTLVKNDDVTYVTQLRENLTEISSAQYMVSIYDTNTINAILNLRQILLLKIKVPPVPLNIFYEYLLINDPIDLNLFKGFFNVLVLIAKHNPALALNEVKNIKDLIIPEIHTDSYETFEEFTNTLLFFNAFSDLYSQK